MATHDFQERMDQRTSEAVQGGRTYTRVYRDVVDDRISEAQEMLFVIDTGMGFPGLAIGAAHPDDAGTIISSVKCEDESADGRQWKVTVTWSTPRYGALAEDPLSRPVELTWSTQDVQEKLFKDFSTTPQEIVNSVGLPFDDLVTRETGQISCEYIRNETTTFFRGTVMVLMADSNYVVNSASFTLDTMTIPANRARLKIKSAQLLVEGATTYYRVSYLIEIRRGFSGYPNDGWRTRYLDRGHYSYGVSGGTVSDRPEPIRDADGQIIQQAYPLDGTGQHKANATDDPAVLGPFKLHPEVAFAPLSFA